MPLSKGNKQVPLSKKAGHNNDSATIVGMAISVMVDQNELYGGVCGFSCCSGPFAQ